MNLPLRFLPLLGLAVLLLAGCGPRPQNVRLNPPVKVSPSKVGESHVVWLRVVDARPRKTLGMIGDLEPTVA